MDYQPLYLSKLGLAVNTAVPDTGGGSVDYQSSYLSEATVGQAISTTVVLPVDVMNHYQGLLTIVSIEAGPSHDADDADDDNDDDDGVLTLVMFIVHFTSECSPWSRSKQTNKNVSMKEHKTKYKIIRAQQYQARQRH